MTVYSQAGSTPDLTWVQPPVTTTLLTMAQAIHSAIDQAALGRGLELPSRRVTYMLPIPADCAQVAVLFGGWEPEPPWEGTVVCAPYRWMGRFGVMITRASPAVPPRAGQAPPPEALMKAAVLASEDAELMLEVIASLGELGRDLLVETMPAEGGFQSVTLTVVLPAFGAS